MKRIALAAVTAAGFLSAYAADVEPFAVSVELGGPAAGARVLSVRFAVRDGHYLYADSISVTSGREADLTPGDIPAPVKKHDPYLEKIVGIYDEDTVFTYGVGQDVALPLTVSVSYQGCSSTLCFPPRTEEFSVGGGTPALAPAAAAVSAAGIEPEPVPASLEARLRRFAVAARGVGYLKKADFMALLDQVASGADGERDALANALENRGLWLAALLILAGGLALNLTPCVLPMIPINLAIIGAGAQAGSRGRGFALGALYGLGIALVYGVLGLVVILTGARFGALNSSPWFNLVIALVFGVLALAMFDVFAIDLSRFQGKAGTASSRRGGFLTALLLGGVAALLAGACVAPVVISVLLLSANLYARGKVLGLLLPFLLGAGMALPWPFAGAGLSFLPKPGKWMVRVKAAFGVAILLFAAWYAYLGVSLLRGRAVERSGPPAQGLPAAEESGWLTSLPEAMQLAEEEGKPLLIDFWASWCKNCLHMDKTTFADGAVKKRLASYVTVKYRAEDLQNPDTRAVLDLFDVIGLPTYVILQPQ